MIQTCFKRDSNVMKGELLKIETRLKVIQSELKVIQSQEGNYSKLKLYKKVIQSQ